MDAAGISRDEWLKALGEAIDTPDPNAITTSEFAQLIGLGRTAARHRLARLVETGKAVRTSKMVLTGTSTTRCTAYRLVKAKGKR